MATKKKGLGGFMKSKAAEKATTEEELNKKDEITPDDVMALKVPCKGYLCKPSDNVYGVEFRAFKLRDLDRGATLFEVAKPDDAPPDEIDDEDDSARFVQYNFPPAFLQLKNVGATVTFQVGKKEVKDFRMIERHFFRDRLLKSFDFSFGFCIPGSQNTIEHIYEFPTLTDSECEEMIASPYETKSDSFYFVDGKLMMHNKAEYAYHDE
eukprot:m.14854 g.14854  ORF g.14854 m.14854 type:complete len:209 (+) comp5229_c0_seq1:17-643(+)